MFISSETGPSHPLAETCEQAQLGYAQLTVPLHALSQLLTFRR
ncbi:hypothetical protein Lpp22_1578 [Lacticaseibacillus paracasei subsp. paracasei Lpp22]|uniref:Uncharacterized protein n=1 Tax=Lacticaseibacillus paracasei subsp. paracasei Lpp22 TaxID=1256221 RepID=A0A8E0I9W8_LACPA|nr:hypothetical protein Lpp22_1578 [Lacticaseibacillus paracasei subsp. paracasei Lpp22]